MNVDDLSQYVGFDRLSFLPSELSADKTLVSVSDKHVVALSLNTVVNDGVAYPSKSSVLEFDTETTQSRAPTAVAWIDAQSVCVGFESGLMIGFDLEGEELFHFMPCRSPVRCLRVSEDSKDAARLWSLHAEGLVVSITLRQLVQRRFDEATGFRLHAGS
ncbi:MAG: hypothetical protein EOP84_30785, partial [Verrucomicrobiaceae bacterium]